MEQPLVTAKRQWGRETLAAFVAGGAASGLGGLRQSTDGGRADKSGPSVRRSGYAPRDRALEDAHRRSPGPGPDPATQGPTSQARKIILTPFIPPMQFRVSGQHDGYPWHELYINGVLFYAHDPCATGEGFGSLGPPMEHDLPPDLSVWRPVPQP